LRDTLLFLSLKLLDTLFWSGQVFWHRPAQALDSCPHFMPYLMKKNGWKE
jgi:hypothetical protein